jgi:hypothetical protein
LKETFNFDAVARARAVTEGVCIRRARGRGRGCVAAKESIYASFSYKIVPECIECIFIFLGPLCSSAQSPNLPNNQITIGRTLTSVKRDPSLPH